jgi:hypothetical protein
MTAQDEMKNALSEGRDELNKEQDNLSNNEDEQKAPDSKDFKDFKL